MAIGKDAHHTRSSANLPVDSFHRIVGPDRTLVFRRKAVVAQRFQAAGLNWPLPAEMPEAELERKLFAADSDSAKPDSKAVPDFAEVHEELQRHKHTTLEGCTSKISERCPQFVSRASAILAHLGADADCCETG